jgi:hypothetical protein
MNVQDVIITNQALVRRASDLTLGPVKLFFRFRTKLSWLRVSKMRFKALCVWLTLLIHQL